MGYTVHMNKVSNDRLGESDAQRIALRAGEVFLPRTAVNTRDLFAGRSRQIEEAIDAVSQIGLHAIIYGERGVGKTSLANIISPYLEVLNGGSGVSGRQVVKVNCGSADTFAGVWLRAFAEVDWPTP